MNLYAVVLGGRAKKCNIELHDVVFVCGENIEDTYLQLLDKWFGMPEKMHIDSYLLLDQVDGYKIELSEVEPAQSEKLFFINMGAYKKGDFMEHHANGFLIGNSALEVKNRAKRILLAGYDEQHKDDLYEIDDLLAIDKIGAYHVNLIKNGITKELDPVNGYHVLPKEVVKNFLKLRENIS